MHEDVAALVHSVINHGLQLWKRLDQGESPNIATEQAILKDLLLTEVPGDRRIDFDGDPWGGRESFSSQEATGLKQKTAERFLGIRYALVCWLDEIFTCDSPWATRWNEQKLEMELYGTNDRAWMFWQQSKIAQTRIGSDAFEAFFLCSTLGFRGELREKPQELQAWFASAKRRLGKLEEKSWPYASELEPPARVPPLRGREILRRMILTGWAVTLVAIPAMVFLLLYKLGQ